MPAPTYMLQAALKYAKRGWRVFPLNELNKTPRIAVADGGKGIHDSTTDEARITAWWTKWPSANIGIHALDFFVLDVDVKRHDGLAELEWLSKTYGPLPETLIQISPSGGRHFLFKKPKGTYIKNEANVHSGIDTRISRRLYPWLAF